MLVVRSFCPRFHCRAREARRPGSRSGSRFTTNYIAKRDLLPRKRMHHGLHSRGHLQSAFRILDMVVNGAFTQAGNLRGHPIAFALRGEFETLARIDGARQTHAQLR